MRILIAEDDLTSRKFLLKFLSRYGECDLVVDGLEVLDAFLLSIKENKKYDLICLDIMMPKVDGIRILQTIRDLELQKGIKKEDRSIIIMTTAMTDTLLVQQAFDIGCDAYAAKPIDTEKLVQVIEEFKLI
ncbi:MAG: response regulator transcription factor [Clostridiales bacterium]|nr:response regulator transcription factor [Clostridiales bacterium]